VYSTGSLSSLCARISRISEIAVIVASSVLAYEYCRLDLYTIIVQEERFDYRDQMMPEARSDEVDATDQKKCPCCKPRFAL
jgi:hypothetical protein